MSNTICDLQLLQYQFGSAYIKALAEDDKEKIEYFRNYYNNIGKTIITIKKEIKKTEPKKPTKVELLELRELLKLYSSAWLNAIILKDITKSDRLFSRVKELSDTLTENGVILYGE